LRQVISEKGQELARDYVQRFPAHGMSGARLLAASGADPAEVNAAIVAVVESTRYGTPPNNDAVVPADINGIVYDALDIGAYDAALVAAEAQVTRNPDSPNGYDTLAHVHAARGEFDAAVAIAERGIEVAGRGSPMTETLRSTISQAKNSSVEGIAYECPRNLLQPLLVFPGENLLFVDEFPEAAVRRALQSSLNDLARECIKSDGIPPEVVVVIRLGEGGTIAELQVLTPSVSTEDSACLRERARHLRVPLDLPGLEVMLVASLQREP
jgi:hypothetical protein